MALNPFRRKRRERVRVKKEPGRVRRVLAAGTDPLLDLLQPDGPRAPRGLLRLLVLVTFGLFWIAFGSAETTYDIDATGRGPLFFVSILVCAPLLLAVARPLPALMFSAGTAFVLGALLPVLNSAPWPWLVVHGLILFALLFASCVRGSLREAAGAWLLVTVLFWWGVGGGPAGNGWAAGLASIALVGVLSGRLLRAGMALRAQTEVSESERARRVVLEERTRLARDLHDIVAHHMSLVVVQAETAQYRVPGLDQAARDEMQSISETARSALTETRALLAVLRQENAQPENAPQPGLHLLPELVETTRRAGVQLDAQITGDVGLLREGRSLAGYRIIQEALANASRHAPGTPVRLEVHADVPGVDVGVTNGVVGGAAPTLPRLADGSIGWTDVGAVTESGHGIIGMRERAAAAGGRLQVGPTAEEFVVQLFLPGDPADGR